MGAALVKVEQSAFKREIDNLSLKDEKDES